MCGDTSYSFFWFLNFLPGSSFEHDLRRVQGSFLLYVIHILFIGNVQTSLSPRQMCKLIPKKSPARSFTVSSSSHPIPTSLNLVLDTFLFQNMPMLIFFLIYFFMYLFLAALGLRCCLQAFCSCGERGLLSVVVRGLLIAVSPLVAEHGL